MQLPYERPDPTDIESPYLDPEKTEERSPRDTGTVVDMVILVTGFGLHPDRWGRVLRVTSQYVSVLFREIAPVDLRLFNRVSGLTTLREGDLSGLRLSGSMIEWIDRFHPDKDSAARPDNPVSAYITEHEGIGAVYGFQELPTWDPDVRGWLDGLRETQYPRFRIPVRR